MSDEVITLIITSVIWVIIVAIIFEVRINDIARHFKRLKPLTQLQKEIREEERIINEIEAQKADIERLAALKRERDALFEELGERHFKRVQVSRNDGWVDASDYSRKVLRDCPYCDQAMTYYEFNEDYDWFCHNCLSRMKIGRAHK